MVSETERLTEKARRNPDFLKTNEFIYGRLFDRDLDSVLLEMGPNCNLNCFHCAINCGTKREGLPKPGMIKNALSGALRAGANNVVLGNGEPLREENRESVGLIAKLSGSLPVCIMTNGTFSRSYESSVEWFEYLKRNGFDLRTRFNSIKVSFGKMYPTNKDNFLKINRAAKEVFADIDLGRFLFYDFIGLGNLKDSERRFNEAICALEETFGERKKARMGKYGNNDVAFVYPRKGSAFKVAYGIYEPYGRANKIAEMEEVYPTKLLSSANTPIEFDTVNKAVVFYNGDVHFNCMGDDYGRNQPYGNVQKEPLIDIFTRMRLDPVFQAFKLGGSPLLYYGAKNVDPKFEVTGRLGYDITKKVLGDLEMTGEVRKYFSRVGIVESYKELVSTLDLTNPAFRPPTYVPLPESVM